MPSRLARWLITATDLPLPYLNQQPGYLKFSKRRLFFFYLSSPVFRRVRTKQQLVLSCLSVCLSVRLSVLMKQLGSHWTDLHDI